MIEWGQKSKPQKIPGPNINPPTNSISNVRAMLFVKPCDWDTQGEFSYSTSNSEYQYVLSPYTSLIL